jgi:hypothetical protein
MRTLWTRWPTPFGESVSSLISLLPLSRQTPSLTPGSSSASCVVLSAVCSDKIAECAEGAYERFPVEETHKLLMLDNEFALKQFATKVRARICVAEAVCPTLSSRAPLAARLLTPGRHVFGVCVQRGWVAHEGIVHFKADGAGAGAGKAGGDVQDVPSLKIMGYALKYATEIERIV